MILAMCKIAQRVDTYLQQIGIGAPTTGGNMLDDLIAGARSFGRISDKLSGGKGGGNGEGGASRQGILGSYLSRTNLGAAVGAASDNAKKGGTLKSAFKAGADAYKQNFKNNTATARFISRATAAYNESKNPASTKGAIEKSNEKAVENGEKKSTAQRHKDGAKAGIAGAGSGALYSLTGYDTEKGFTPSKENIKASEDAAKANADAVQSDAVRFQSGNSKMPDDLKTEVDKFRNGDPSRLGNAAENMANYGAADENGNNLKFDQNKGFELSDQAIAAGARMASDKNGEQSVVGNQNAVSDFLARATDGSAVNADGNKTFAAGIFGKEDYINSNMQPDSYYQSKGKEAALKAQANDNKTIAAYQSSFQSDPGVKSAMANYNAAKSNVEFLRAQNAPAEQIQAAEQRYQAAETSLHGAVSTASANRVEEASKRIEAMNAQGISSSAPEYQAAEQNLKTASDQRNSYMGAYARVSQR